MFAPNYVLGCRYKDFCNRFYVLHKRKERSRWKFRPGPVPERENMTLLCRVNPDDKGFHSFYIFRRVESSKTRQLKEHDRWLETGERLSQLSDFYLAAKRLALTPDSAQ
jgi:hypothetical protein